MTLRKIILTTRAARKDVIVQYALKTGERPKAIAEHFGIRPNTVREVLSRARARGVPLKSFIAHGGSTLPNHTEEQLKEKRKIIEAASQNPRPNASQIKKMLNCPLSVNTIRRVVQDHFDSLRDARFVEPCEVKPPVVRSRPTFQERSIRELIELGVGLTKIAALKRLPYSQVIQVANAARGIG